MINLSFIRNLLYFAYYVNLYRGNDELVLGMRIRFKIFEIIFNCPKRNGKFLKNIIKKLMFDYVIIIIIIFIFACLCYMFLLCCWNMLHEIIRCDRKILSL